MRSVDGAVLVIGLDGGTFRLLRPMMERGLMPHLGSLIEGGTQGDLQSTIPPITAPAWSSFMTGKNPGKHQLFGWQEPLDQRGERRWANSGSIRGEKLWHALGRQGRDVGVLNVPMTYPPEEVNGFLVSGMLTPSVKSEFTYPKELKGRLQDLGYVIDVYARGQEVDTDSEEALLQFATGLEEAVLSKARAIELLWPRRLNDFSMVVLETPDRIQHFMWGHVEQALGGKEPEGRGGIETHILTLYREVDGIVGQLLTKLENGGHVFVVSDHGFCGLHTYVHLGNWLESEGLLKYAKRIALRRRTRGLLGVSKRILPERAVARGRDILGAAKLLDWSQTRAYPGHPSERAIRINLRGREPEGVVEPGVEYERLRGQIQSRLTQLRDPRNGNAVVSRVFLPEEIYSGPYVKQAPDLLLEMAEGYHMGFGIGGPDILENVRAKGLGVHERAGILIACGPRIGKGNKIENASIMDVAPTVFHVMGLEVPADMDGKVLQELFEPAFLDVNPVRYTDSYQEELRDTVRDTFSEEEAADIHRRLKGLGYVD